MMQQHIEIRFGALSPPLHEQLDVPKEHLEFEQQLYDAIILCKIHSVLSGSESQRAQQRLFKRILEKLKEIQKC